jgi:hypothetical protein
MIGKIRGVGSVALIVGLVLQACAKTDTGGGSGSETHWLATCETDADCQVGACLCGVCSVACSTSNDCPAPLDQCLDRSPDGVQCEQLICQRATPAQSPEASGSQGSPLVQVIATCDGERPTNLARVMTTPAEVLEDPGIGAGSHVVPKTGGGFLLVDGQGAVTHLTSAGSFVRKLAAPFERVRVTDVALLADGSAYFAGSKDERAWVGRVNSSWQPSWEKPLPYVPSYVVDVETLPDGSALVAGTGTLPTLRSEPSETYVASWTNVSTAGVVAYEKTITYEGAFNEHGSLAVSSTGFYVALATTAGIMLVRSDFDGNYSTLPPLNDGVGWEVRDVRGLPDGRVALLTGGGLLLADDTGVLEEFQFQEGVEVPRALEFDATRGELVIAGGYSSEGGREGTWLKALDMSSATAWELQRAAWPAGVADASLANVYGDLLYDVAVDEAGNIVAIGTFAQMHVNVLWVGDAQCDL